MELHGAWCLKGDKIWIGVSLDAPDSYTDMLQCNALTLDAAQSSKGCDVSGRRLVDPGQVRLSMRITIKHNNKFKLATTWGRNGKGQTGNTLFLQQLS